MYRIELQGGTSGRPQPAPMLAGAAAGGVGASLRAVDTPVHNLRLNLLGGESPPRQGDSAHQSSESTACVLRMLQCRSWSAPRAASSPNTAAGVPTLAGSDAEQSQFAQETTGMHGMRMPSALWPGASSTAVFSVEATRVPVRNSHCGTARVYGRHESRKSRVAVTLVIMASSALERARVGRCTLRVARRFVRLADVARALLTALIIL